MINPSRGVMVILSFDSSTCRVLMRCDKPFLFESALFHVTIFDEIFDLAIKPEISW